MNALRAPAAPVMNPDSTRVRQDLNQASVQTQKYGPDGKILPQYRQGIGAKILGSLANFASGMGGRGPVIYVGPGATNRAYARAEEQRANRAQADRDKIKSYEDEYNQAEKGYGHDLTSYQDEVRQAADEEKQRHDREVEDLRSQLQEARDPQTRLLAEKRARAAIANEMSLPRGYARNSYILTGKLTDDDATNRRLADLEERLGLMRERNELDREKAKARGNKSAQVAPNLSPLQSKSYKSPGGKVWKAGDKIPDGRVIKGFAKDRKTGEVHATF